MKDPIKQFYADEVSKARTPPFTPRVKQKDSSSNLWLSICAAASILILFSPGFTNSRIRNLEISQQAVLGVTQEFNLGFQSVAAYYSKERWKNE